MSPTEITAYVQIAIGLLGIVMTVLGSPALTSLFRRSSKGQVQSDDPFGAALRKFATIFVLMFSVFLVCLGLATTLQPVAVAFGAVSPMLTSVLVIATLCTLAVVVTMYVYRIPYWLPGFIAAMIMGLCALAAAISKDTSILGLIIAMGMMIFLFTGMAALVGDKNLEE